MYTEVLDPQIIINLLQKTLKSKDKDLQNTIFKSLGNIMFTINNETNDQFKTLFEVVLKYLRQSEEIQPEGYLALHLLQTNMDLRLKRHVLDSNTYVKILETDLNTCSKGDKLKTVTLTYTGFLKHEMQQNQFNESQLGVIQRAIQQSPDQFQDADEFYKEIMNAAYKKIIRSTR